MKKNNSSDYLINQFLEPLVNTFKRKFSLEVVKSFVWALGNFTKVVQKPTKELTKKLLPFYQRIFNTFQDMEVIYDCLRGITNYLSNGDSQTIQLVVTSGIIKNLLSILYFLDEERIVYQCLGVFIELLCGNDKQTDQILSQGFLYVMRKVLSTSNHKIFVTACQAIANVTGGNTNHVQATINSEILYDITLIAKNTNSKDIKMEALMILKNSIGESKKQRDYLISLDIVNILILGLQDEQYLICFTGLYKLIEVS